jgi:hypothetical protein
MTESPYAVRWGSKVRLLADWQSRRDALFTSPPRIGLVVGTFAAIPYVHLHLEARRRFYPDVPMLLHDDCSPRGAELEKLCASYGVEFASTATRFPPCKGDLSAMATGFVWAREREIDLLVKMSRRFIPLVPWAEDLATLALRSQYATYSSWTTSFDFGFRTECVGFAVREWFALGLFDEIVTAILAPGALFVEGFIHVLARHAGVRNSRSARAFDAAIGERPASRNGYAPWPFLGTDRCTANERFLWHDSAEPEAYAALAECWQLPYCAADFQDPNMGCGSVEE